MVGAYVSQEVVTWSAHVHFTQARQALVYAQSNGLVHVPSFHPLHSASSLPCSEVPLVPLLLLFHRGGDQSWMPEFVADIAGGGGGAGGWGSTLNAGAGGSFPNLPTAGQQGGYFGLGWSLVQPLDLQLQPSYTNAVCTGFIHILGEERV